MNRDSQPSTMLRLVVLLFVCAAIAANNDTFGNLISNEEQSNLKKQPDNWSANNRTLDEQYKDAVQAYLEEDWSRCINDFNAVLQGYKIYRRTIVNCRQKCRGQAAGTAPIFPENIDDMHFYEKKVKETLCLLRCNQEYREIAGSRALKTLPRDTEHKLVNHRVYEYLHLCYYQEHRYQDAANALFTYLVIYPDHEASIETLKRYLELPGVQPEAVVNLETAPYVSIYFKGVSTYENEDYAQAAALFEASLSSYIESEEECRFYCEGPFDQGWHPEFTSSVANHFTFCLRCKRACSQRLNNVNGNYRSDMLKSHYNYLQFSYYKLGKLKAACAAVESYLLFDSLDETMQNNKAYYRAQPKVQEEYFTARQEAVDYVKRQEYELSLLRYISNEFSVIDAKFSKMNNNKNKKKKEADRENEKEKELGKVKNEI